MDLIVLFQTSSLQYVDPSMDLLLHGFRFHQSNLTSNYGSGFQTMVCDPTWVLEKFTGAIFKKKKKKKKKKLKK
jgi:hypothetical protein